MIDFFDLIYKHSKMSSNNDLFTSKANVLKYLQSTIKKSKIEKIYDFTVSNWQYNKIHILNHISKNFNSKIVVRSSAFGEDSISNSQAGKYDTILNVNSQNTKQVKQAIETVIKSYKLKGKKFNKNQILIQNQAKNVKTNGVLFTKTADLGSPYFVIDYDDSDSTDSVTKGLASNTIRIFKNTTKQKIPNKWKKLLNAAEEIEAISNLDSLDIEFAITKNNQIIIFQVRPITTIKKSVPNNLLPTLSKLIQKNKNKFLKLTKKSHVPGITIFSDMSDWNPSEIIGNNPNLLDYSLYDYLVMKNSWHKGRSILGYQNVNPYSLMIQFGNKPYVDVRGSFNSLIPSNLPKKLKTKLMHFYIKKLSEFPHLHDKVEFEILFSCYDVTLDNRLKELRRYNFSKNEILILKTSLIKLTNKIISDFPNLNVKCNNSLAKMHLRRNLLISELDKSSKNHKNILKIVSKLLRDCHHFGTLQFVSMARIAFISSILLKSLETKGKIPSSTVASLMSSLSTPLTEIQNDVMAFHEKRMAKKSFLEKYGHLRPGTYDITAPRYDMSTQLFDNITFHKSKSHKEKVEIHFFNILIQKLPINFTKINFLDFFSKSIVQREKIKFEFTKNMSLAIELIADTGTILGFTREEISHLDINTILSSQKLSKIAVQKLWRTKIKYNKQKKIYGDFLSLPPLLYSIDDFEIIQYPISKPNFVTDKKISSKLINLKNTNKRISSLKNSIVLIENADPGYDWIFSLEPSGLITKYGGVASHMAIRCAEIGLPAAIGCGELLYEKLSFASTIMIDCFNKEILILEQSKNDDFEEERKTLKSLGYIK